MVAQVDSPAFKACLDVPLFTCQDDAWVYQAVRAAGPLQIHTHFNGEFQRDADGRVVEKSIPAYKRGPVNYPTFVRALKEIGYTGYHCFEFCHEALDGRMVAQGREYVDEQAALALEYLRDIMVEEGVYES
jgi:sugar phosphate isomerase/epimerase